MKKGRVLSAAIALAASLSACDSAGTIGPDNQLQVTNATDNFQFQVSNLDNVTETLTYTWANTGTQANVNQSCAITGGTAMVTVTQGSTQLYSGDLKNNGTFVSTAGTAGNWTVTVTLTKVTGTLNFRVQKRP